MKFLKRIIPSYSIIPALSIAVVGFLVYFATKMITDGGHHYDISLPIDHKFPFIPVFVIFYILSYVQWVTGYLTIAREEENFALRAISAEIIAKFICLAIFLILPTTMARPEIVGNDIFSKLTGLIYSADTPTNLFPSIHCLESWIIFRTSFGLKRVGRWITPVYAVFALLVFLTVLFIRQHLILDIPAGIMVGELSLYISRRFKTERVFKKLNSRFIRKG